jgi:hypothetical protein
MNWSRDSWRLGNVQIDIRPDGLVPWRRQFTPDGVSFTSVRTARPNGLGIATLFKAATEASA